MDKIRKPINSEYYAPSSGPLESTRVSNLFLQLADYPSTHVFSYDATELIFHDHLALDQLFLDNDM